MRFIMFCVPKYDLICRPNCTAGLGHREVETGGKPELLSEKRDKVAHVSKDQVLSLG